MATRYRITAMKKANGWLLDAVAMHDDGRDQSVLNLCRCDPESTPYKSFLVRCTANLILESLGCEDPEAVEVECFD